LAIDPPQSVHACRQTANLNVKPAKKSQETSLALFTQQVMQEIKLRLFLDSYEELPCCSLLTKHGIKHPKRQLHSITYATWNLAWDRGGAAILLIKARLDGSTVLGLLFSLAMFI
jgi:hypothetical protein